MRGVLHRVVLSFAALVFSAVALHAQNGNQTQVQDLFRQGAQAMRAGQVAAAEAAFRKATEIDPTLAAAHLDLGLAQLKLGKLTEAIASIHKALALDPNAAGAHMFLGIAEYQSNHIDQAVLDLRQEIANTPTNAEALLWLGIVELQSGHPEKATAPLDRAAKLDPKDLNVLDYRGQAHMAVAKQSYAQMYHLDPGSWRVHRLNAQIDAEAEQHKQAIDEYLAAIRIAPKEADLYEGLGEEYRQTGQADLAEKAFAEQLQLTPGNPIAMYNLGSVRVDRGEEKAAVPLLQDVVRIYGMPTVANYYLGRALVAEGDYRQADAELQRATTVQGEVQRRAWYELGQLYRKMGRPADAHAALVKFQQLRQAADLAKNKEVEDWRKLNAASRGSSTMQQPAQ
ncbi:MAG TPA: tetratricopeptide repeat protein [Acidobacteriaceae bacterium]|nr:tetratricopeptide repeat protein [Acidobacteriaceae bacterium]